MALIPVVGRKTAKMRLVVALLYLALSLGAVTMVYPFLVMLGASVQSQYEKADYGLVPRYLYSERALFGKYAEDKYRGDMTLINASYGTDYAALQDVAPPGGSDPAAARRWNEFAAALPMRYKAAGFGGAAAAYSPSPLLDRYHQFLSQRFRGSITALDQTYNEEDEQFQTVFPPFEQPAKHNWTPGRSVKELDWAKFEETLPPHTFLVVGADPLYQKWLKEEAYVNLDALSKDWGISATSYAGFKLPTKPMGNAAQRRNWGTFVRTKLPFRDVALAPSALPSYQVFLQSRYKNNIADYNAKYGAALKSFQDVKLADANAIPAAGPPLLDWMEFLKVVPLTALTADTPETRWGRGIMPVQLADWEYVRGHTTSLRTDFLTRNYGLVWQFLALHGDALKVTCLYCLLAILTTLIVNPLCAYALSRYNLSYGNAVLLFLLATMSFPGEVSLIQNFLLLKQFGLLNTYFALILPGAASGFSIFLLKGFFDSLPKELYEAGTLDGASELRMFWTITLPLSRPIFAVIGLGAFTAAYTGFLYAMTICQDHKMWTMMVWLYELSASGAPVYVMMAALTLTSIPTLFVFIFAQKTIMRGIILPSFK